MNAAVYREFPAPPGTGFACLWTHHATEPYVQRVVPDGCVDLIWWNRYGRIEVAGPDTGPNPARLEPGDVLIGLRFRPGTAPATLGVPADAIKDGRVPLTDLWGPDAERLEETVATAPDQHRALLSGALDRTAAQPDPLVPALLDGLQDHSVQDLADAIGLGERQLRRRSIAAFGYGPKTLQRVLRFQRALSLARTGRPLAEVAHETGYADQAHMSNEARDLGGAPIRTLL